MKTRLFALLTTMSLLLVGTVALGAPAQAMAKIKCKMTTGAGEVDPIVHHNEPVGGAMSSMIHKHQFFGNNAFLAMANPNTASYADLMGKGTNCANTADTAGYWTPQLQNKATGAAVPVQAFTAYYRPFEGVGGPDMGPGMAFPADTRLLASQYDWNCGDQSGALSTPVSSIPSCVGLSGRPGLTLTSHVTFPTCWDGVRPSHKSTDAGSTTDNAHYAYKTKVKGVSICPAGFPNKMVELRETTAYTYTGAGADLELTSDAMAGTTDGRSLHADFWNTWQQAGLESMVRNCINTGGVFTTTECG